MEGRDPGVGVEGRDPRVGVEGREPGVGVFGLPLLSWVGVPGRDMTGDLLRLSRLFSSAPMLLDRISRTWVARLVGLLPDGVAFFRRSNTPLEKGYCTIFHRSSIITLAIDQYIVCTRVDCTISSIPYSGVGNNMMCLFMTGKK